MFILQEDVVPQNAAPPLTMDPSPQPVAAPSTNSPSLSDMLNGNIMAQITPGSNVVYKTLEIDPLVSITRKDFIRNIYFIL